MHQMTNPDLHKGWKCFTVLADEQTKQYKPHAQLACLHVLMLPYVKNQSVQYIYSHARDMALSLTAHFW